MNYENYIIDTLAFVAEEIEKEIAPKETISSNEITRTN